MSLKVTMLEVEGAVVVFTVDVRTEGDSVWRTGEMAGGDGGSNVWTLRLTCGEEWGLDLRALDPLALALHDAHLPFGENPLLDPAGPRCLGGGLSDAIALGFPAWPEGVRESLGQQQVHGSGVVVFEADKLLDHLLATAVPRPVLFPHGRARAGLREPRAWQGAVRQLARHGDDLRGALREAGGGAGVLGQPSGGRLIGVLPGGEMVQCGDTIQSSLAATEPAPVEVTLTSSPMGLGFSPVAGGTGAEVVEVDRGGHADRRGVRVGWRFRTVRGRDVREMEFGDIDALFDEAMPVTIVFDTHLAAEHFYAVEMPAGPVLSACASSAQAAAPGPRGPVDASASASEGSAVAHLFRTVPKAALWKEAAPKLFVGAGGSMTCLHRDLFPQVEICQVLTGTKLLALAPYETSAELLAEHSGEGRGEDCETRVPSSTRLAPHEESLLRAPGLGVVAGRPGDLLLFSSGAAHFATNGAVGLCAAIFEGVVTPASLPLLLDPSFWDPFPEGKGAERYARHMSAPVLLTMLAEGGGREAIDALEEALLGKGAGGDLRLCEVLSRARAALD